MISDWDNFNLMFECKEDKITIHGDKDNNLREIVFKLAWILVVLAAKADIKEDIKSLLNRTL